MSYSWSCFQAWLSPHAKGEKSPSRSYQVSCGWLQTTSNTEIKLFSLCNDRERFWQRFSGLPDSPKTKSINGILVVGFPHPNAQVSFWRCNLHMNRYVVVPGACRVPNPPNPPVVFWDLKINSSTWLGQEPLKRRVLAAASRCFLGRHSKNMLAKRCLFKDSAQHWPMLRTFILVFLGSIGEIGDPALGITFEMDE